jgi:hypothetical protein
MKELTQFNWKAFDSASVTSGAKFAIGVVVMMVIQNLTGESWMITSLIALFAWLVNVPGPLKDRIGGMLGFALGAILCTLLAAMIGPEMLSGIIALSVVGLLGTTAALWGTRAGMVGWAIIMYMIYAPSFVAGIGLEQTIFAIVIGVGVLFVLNVVEVVIKPDGRNEPESTGEVGADSAYIAAYALIIALVLGVATWMGQSIKTDPLMVTGAAFFVIGFDQRKTWVGGIARMIGISLGILMGTLMVSLIGPGLFLQVLLVAAAFLCFATAPVHPSLLMFFLTIYFAGGWQGMQWDALELTINEKIAGESVGVVLAFVAIGLLRYWQGTRGVAEEGHS